MLNVLLTMMQVIGGIVIFLMVLGIVACIVASGNKERECGEDEL